MWLFDLLFPQFCKSDMSRYRYLKVFRYNEIMRVDCIFFLTFSQNHMLWYSLEVPHLDNSNEYPQHIFLWRNKKMIFFLLLYKKICCGYSLETSRWGTSNEYLNRCFCGEIRKHSPDTCSSYVELCSDFVHTDIKVVLVGCHISLFLQKCTVPYNTVCM